MVVGTTLREATAYHEAGHAMFGVVAGLRFRYVTLRPRGGYVGLVMTTGVERRGGWRDEAASLFAGVLAEDLWWIDHGYSTCAAQRRRNLTCLAGRDDMRNARDVVRAAWSRQRVDQSYSLTPIGSDWTVRDLATEAWRHAVFTLLAHSEAVRDLAELLLSQSRAVTWAQACEVVARCEVDPRFQSALPNFTWVSDLLRPWFLDHSRLSWEPMPAAVHLSSPPVAAGGSDA